ncbi:MAG: mechanosensitive ion channel family protein [Candidatus Promineifilaceae bacterium]|nr:mechanosensitive ion channel family protein [Candidatus Promineifilaceae bacterium]
MAENLINLVSAAAILAGAIILSWLSAFVLDFAARRLFRKTATKLDDFVVSGVKGPLRVLIIIIGLDLALAESELIPAAWQGGTEDVFFVIYLIMVVFIANRVVGAVSDWYSGEVVAATETDLDDKFLSFFRALADIIIVTIAIVIFLGHFGIEPSALVTTLGIGTLAVALAAQETLRDMIAGFMIMIDRPFAVGDRIEILDIDTWGDVIEIGLRSTRILTRDNRLVAVPNSVIGKGLVVNYSVPNTVYRVQTHVGVAYGTDLEEARAVMIAAIEAEEWIMHERPVEALMLEFADSALIFRVRCWIENYVETRRVMDKMNSALYKALNEAGIAIPFPQRVVQLQPNGLVEANQR